MHLGHIEGAQVRRCQEREAQSHLASGPSTRKCTCPRNTHFRRMGKEDDKRAELYWPGFRQRLQIIKSQCADVRACASSEL